MRLSKYLDLWQESGLCDRLGGSNSDGRVFNSNFKQWRTHIERNLDILSKKAGSKYADSPDNKLFQICCEHVKFYESPCNNNSKVFLVHPFYLPLTQFRQFTTIATRRHTRKYLDNLVKLLESRTDRKKYEIVALDTLHHYAASTSLLLEKGLIDNIIFTRYDSGIPVDIKELSKYFNKKIIFAGGYNKKCLSDSIYCTRRYSNDLWGIPELILNSPRYHKYVLKPKSVHGLPDTRLIKYKEFLMQLKSTI